MRDSGFRLGYVCDSSFCVADNRKKLDFSLHFSRYRTWYGDPWMMRKTSRTMIRPPSLVYKGY